MPQKPEDLSRIIMEMAARIADKLGYKIETAALSRIGLIPEPHASQKTISVDLAKLEEMISDVIKLAIETTKRQKRDMIDQQAIEAALIEVKCHYLWFC